MWQPKGLILLREAVLRTAERAAPGIDVRGYVGQPNPAAVSPVNLIGLALAALSELWPNLGDADLREAAYRGGWKPA